MDFYKLNPWNWFKHENNHHEHKNIIPINRDDSVHSQHQLNSISQIHNEIDRIFNSALMDFNSPSIFHSRAWNQRLRGELSPAFHASLNIGSDEKQYTITLEAPGLEKKDISIELKNRVLVIKGNKKQEQEEKDKHYYRIERQYGEFERILSVPDDGDIDEISANMDKGLLTLTIPRKKTEEVETKKIEIANR